MRHAHTCLALGQSVSQEILRLRYTLGTSSSSWRNTTSAGIVSKQTIVTTTLATLRVYIRSETLVIIRL